MEIFKREDLATNSVLKNRKDLSKSNKNDGFIALKQSTIDKIKHDKSNKGTIDEPIRELVETINSLRDYFTTSSCSGRICINKEFKDLKKTKDVWVFKSHDPVDAKEILDVKLPNENTSIRFETMIIHVVARDIFCACRFLDLVRKTGFKKSGIFSVKTNKVMIECSSTENMHAPFSLGNHMLMDKIYLEKFVAESNFKLRRAHMRIKRLNEALKKEFVCN